jgi:hypothetical protein
MELLKPLMRQTYCSENALYRVCYGVPDESACNATFDQAWPDCTRGVVLHDGPSEEDRKQGQQTARCLGEVFKTRFGVTLTEACTKARAAFSGER